MIGSYNTESKNHNGNLGHKTLETDLLASYNT